MLRLIVLSVVLIFFTGCSRGGMVGQAHPVQQARQETGREEDRQTSRYAWLQRILDSPREYTTPLPEGSNATEVVYTWDGSAFQPSAPVVTRMGRGGPYGVRIGLTCNQLGPNDVVVSQTDLMGGATCKDDPGIEQRLITMEGHGLIPWAVIGRGHVVKAHGSSPVSSDEYCAGLDWESVCIYYDPQTGPEVIWLQEFYGLSP